MIKDDVGWAGPWVVLAHPGQCHGPEKFTVAALHPAASPALRVFRGSVTVLNGDPVKILNGGHRQDSERGAIKLIICVFFLFLF